MTYTYQQLLDDGVGATDEVSLANHQRFYAQLVGDYARQNVLSTFGIERLLASKDRFFNDIPLAAWDRLASIFGPAYNEKANALGCGASISTKVSTLKEAARQLVEQHRANSAA